MKAFILAGGKGTRFLEETNVRPKPMIEIDGKPLIIHIIDHSNAIYLPKIKNVFKKSNLVTCHDLIAVRTAQGKFKEAPPTSTSGRFLQNRILKCLSKASFYACDSKSTMNDLNNMVKKSIGQSEVIHLGTKPSKKNQD